MSTPQIEDGYTRIANELLEAFCTLNVSGSAWRVFMVVLRKTYGFRKKEDQISLTQFSDMSYLSHRSVCRGLNELIDLNIITVQKSGYINTYSVQKNYSLWGSVKPVTTSVKPVTRNSDKNDTESSVKPVTNKRKERNKEISEQSSHQKNMGWKQYNENKHSDDLPVVDSESGEIVDLAAEEKSKNKELTQKKNKAIDWLIDYQNRDVLKTNRPKQMKALNEILKMGVSLREAADLVKEQMESEYWRGKKEKPDFSTVASIIQKRG